MALAIKEVSRLETSDWALAGILFAADKEAFKGVTPEGAFAFDKTEKITKAVEACEEDATKPKIAFSDLQEWHGIAKGKKGSEGASKEVASRKRMTPEMEEYLAELAATDKDTSTAVKAFQDKFGDDSPKEQTLRKRINTARKEE